MSRGRLKILRASIFIVVVSISITLALVLGTNLSYDPNKIQPFLESNPILALGLFLACYAIFNPKFLRKTFLNKRYLSARNRVKVVCNSCEKKFESRDAYLAHIYNKE
jgi:hypothetical protein